MRNFFLRLFHGVRSHLAIDTEFHVKEAQFPGVDLGTVDRKEVQEAIEICIKPNSRKRAA
jgi:hypothetical protein